VFVESSIQSCTLPPGPLDGWLTIARLHMDFSKLLPLWQPSSSRGTLQDSSHDVFYQHNYSPSVSWPSALISSHESGGRPDLFVSGLFRAQFPHLSCYFHQFSHKNPTRQPASKQLHAFQVVDLQESHSPSSLCFLSRTSLSTRVSIAACKDNRDGLYGPTDRSRFVIKIPSVDPPLRRPYILDGRSESR
jgi:hypothetical protein